MFAGPATTPSSEAGLRRLEHILSSTMVAGWASGDHSDLWFVFQTKLTLHLG